MGRPTGTRREAINLAEALGRHECRPSEVEASPPASYRPRTGRPGHAGDPDAL